MLCENPKTLTIITIIVILITILSIKHIIQGPSEKYLPWPADGSDHVRQVNQLEEHGDRHDNNELINRRW